MIFDLIPDSDPRLHSRVPDFDFDNPPTEPVQLFADLVESMRRHHGAGLAANQCGLPYRCFVAYDGEEPFIAFNPEIKLEVGSQTDTEGCLSFPGTLLTVTRAMGVSFIYRNEIGLEITKTAVGFRARAVLHEIDHLNGVVFTERSTEA